MENIKYENLPMGKVVGIDLGTTNSCVAVMEGSLIAENFILSNSSSLLDACTNISDMANNPIKTGTKLIPSNNSSTPKVNLEIPVVK